MNAADRDHVVLDTNIIISAMLFDGPPRKVLRLVIEGAIDCSLSVPILDEVKDVLQRPKFGLSPAICFQLAQEIQGLCRIVTPGLRVDAIPDDPDDNRILECAREAKAQFIITGDHHLLDIREFEGMRILSPTDYLESRGHSARHSSSGGDDLG